MNKKKRWIATITQLIIILILIAMIKGALDEQKALDNRFIALDENIAQLNEKVEYNKQVIESLETEIEQATELAKINEEWFIKYKRFLDVFTND